jgi:hypothetical protein
MARNVRFRWDPWPETTFDDDPLWKSPENSVLFSRGIPYLPPGQELTALFDHFPNRVAKGLRMVETVFVDYDATDRRQFRNERFDLDLEVVKGLRHINKKDLHDLVQSVDKIETTLGRWTDRLSGLRVNVANRDRDQRRERRSINATQARRLYHQQGARAAISYIWNDYRRRAGWYFWD